MHKLAGHEKEIIIALAKFDKDEAINYAGDLGWLQKNQHGEFRRNRERVACEKKLKKLGFEIPW